jgi:uncharacterized protein Usg
MTLVTTPLSELEGYGLTTAKIVYRVPDHQHLLQDFLWQQYDVFPHFPTLRKFLAFWEEKIEGPLHSITVAHVRLLHPLEITSLAGRPLN